jgi:hypothetical protein
MATINDMNDNLTFNFFFLSKRGSDVVCFIVTAFSLFFGRHVKPTVQVYNMKLV